MVIKICVGSSCHLKGAPDLVELLQNAVKDNGLEHEITLAGSFCIGKCNRDGVTIQVDEEVYVGVTKESFKEFWQDKVLAKLK